MDYYNGNNAVFVEGVKQIPRTKILKNHALLDGTLVLECNNELLYVAFATKMMPRKCPLKKDGNIIFLPILDERAVLFVMAYLHGCECSFPIAEKIEQKHIAYAAAYFNCEELTMLFNNAIIEYAKVNQYLGANVLLYSGSKSLSFPPEPPGWPRGGPGINPD